MREILEIDQSDRKILLIYLVGCGEVGLCNVHHSSKLHRSKTIDFAIPQTYKCFIRWRKFRQLRPDLQLQLLSGPPQTARVEGLSCPEKESLLRLVKDSDPEGFVLITLT